MSRQRIAAQYTRLLTRWPLDRLRPAERHFQQVVLQPRTQTEPLGLSRNSESKEINAAYLLLDNLFKKQYRLSERMMKPASDPEHYERLAREFQELPDRTWTQRLVKRFKGMVKWK